MSNQYNPEVYTYNNPYNQTNFQTTEATVVEENPKRKKLIPILILGIAGIIIIVIVALLLINNSRNQPATTGLDPNKKVVLQWWGVFLNTDTVKSLIDEYQSKHPNVTIEYANKWSNLPYNEAQTRYITELNRVLTINDRVQIPDIFMVNNTWVGNYEKFSSPAPSAAYTYDNFNNTFHPAVTGDFANNRKNVYGVPLWMDTFAILYNKDLLASKSVSAPPKDWPGFKILAEQLTSKSSNRITQAGFAAGTTANVSFGFELANILLFQNGVAMLNASNVPNFSTDTDTLNALNFFKAFAANNGTWNTTFKNDSAAFLEGDVAMIVSSSYRYRDILKYNEQYNLGLDIGVSQIPQLEGQSQSLINWADYWGNMVALNRPSADYAWDFLKWMSEADQLKKLNENVKTTYKHFGILYPRKDMIDLLKADENLQVFNESLPFAKTWYMVNGVDVEDEFNQVLSDNNINQSSISRLEETIKTIISNKGKLQ